MGLIEFYYPKIYQNKGVIELEEFNRVLKELYGEYALKYQIVEVAQDGGGSVPDSDMSDGDEDMGNELNQFMLERSQPWNSKSNLDRYLERRPTSCPQGQDFNVLNWWKSEGKDYQILSKLAQDVLAVPISMVASEPAFNTGGRVINVYRSKLDTEVVEALVCIQDWVRASIFNSMEETEEEDGDDNSN